MIRCTPGAENRNNTVPLTVGRDRCKSKLQKEYADGASINHKPVNRLKTFAGYFFPNCVGSVQKLLNYIWTCAAEYSCGIGDWRATVIV